MASINSDKIFGAILGGAVGDAMGAPVELWTPIFIEKQIGSKFIDKFIKTHKNDFIGQYTDDTEMVLSTIQSISECNCVNYSHMFNTFKINFDVSRGYGTNTSDLLTGNSLDKLGAIKKINKKTTNGGLMRISPIALFMLNDMDSEISYVIENTLKITHHDSKESIDACNIFCKLLQLFVKYDKISIDSIFIINYIKTLMEQKKYNIPQLNIVMDNYLKKSCEPNEQFRIAEHINKYYTANVSESLALVINALIWNNCEPIKSLSHVIAYGGDTDTNAGLVGACVGALHGSAWTHIYIKDLENYDTIMKLTTKFYEVITIKNKLIQSIPISSFRNINFMRKCIYI